MDTEAVLRQLHAFIGMLTATKPSVGPTGVVTVRAGAAEVTRDDLVASAQVVEQILVARQDHGTTVRWVSP